MIWWAINILMMVFLVTTLVNLVAELRRQPRRTGRIALEAVWAVVLALILLNNFGLLRIP